MSETARSRRKQATLVGVLALSLAAAAWMASQRRVRWAFPLGEPVVNGELSVRLPAGWQVRQQPGTIWADSIQPVNRVAMRIEVRHDRTIDFISGRDWLVRMERLEPRAPARVPQSLRFGAVNVGGWPGTFVAYSPSSRPPGNEMPHRLAAAAALPNGDAVLIRIDCSDDIGPSALELLRLVAQSAALEGRPSPTPLAGLRRVDERLSVVVPEGFVGADSPGPYQRGLRLTQRRSDGETAVELTTSRLAVDCTRPRI